MASYFRTGLNFVFLALMVACVLGATDPTGESEPSTDSTSTPTPPSMHLSCVKPHGLMPNWEDETCRSYLKCTDFILTELKCDEGQMYSILRNECIDSSADDCEEQNNAVRQTVEASSYLYAYINPSFSQQQGGSMPLIDTSAVSDLLSQLANQGPKRVKRSILQDLGVPAPRDHITNINITLPQEVCEKIDHYTLYLEAVINTVLTMESCPGGTCDLPMFELHCEGEYLDYEQNSTDGSFYHSHTIYDGDDHYHDGDDDEEDGVHVEVEESDEDDEPSGGHVGIGLFNFGHNLAVNDDADTANSSDTHAHEDIANETNGTITNTTSLPVA